MTEVKTRSKLSSWAYALRTTNPPPDVPVDVVTRWLVVTRAAVLPMTLVSGLVAALLAVGEPGLDWRWLVLALIGITLAHMANNSDERPVRHSGRHGQREPIRAPCTRRTPCCPVW